MTKHTRYILFLLVLAALYGCASRKNNTATSRAYHAFFARYNTYYNGNVAYKKAHKTQINGHKDNYLEQLSLLIISNANTQKLGAGDYDKAIEKAQKAIKNHSIKRKPKKPAGKKLTPKQKEFYAQKEFNPFLWKAWFMMADAQMQKGEFAEAASTYIYITRLYENKDEIVARARIGLAKCYTEMEWLYETEDLLQRTARDTVPEKLEEEFAQAKGNLLMRQGRFSEAIPYIEKGIKRDGITGLEKAREYYLLGQLYAITGDKKAAYKSFGKTISTSPPYELEFNARIRQTEMATDENHKKILRKLKRMAKSSKNENYLSQIYYAIGNIHLSQKDTAEAIKAYETGVAEGKAGDYGTGMLHLSLARIYWEKEKFSESHENYGKALSMITEETPGYDEIAFRSSVLGDLVQYTDIVKEQSELLYWATLTPEELNPIIDGRIEEAKYKEELKKKKEKKLERENSGSELDKAGTQAGMTIIDQNEKQQWYFYNPQLVSQGIKGFKQKWGDRSLKDYWRWKNGISSLMTNDATPTDSTEYEGLPEDSLVADSLVAGDMTEVADIADSLSTDPTTREFYLQRIPVTDEQKSAAHEALRNALYESGIRFKDNVNNKELTLKYLERIPAEYPEFERLAETYYQLFLACSRWDEPEKATHYKRLLVENYPDSTMTKLIQEPDFFDNAIVIKEKEDSIYAKAYMHYTQKEYDDVIRENSYSAAKYPNGSHRARFGFIDAMAKLYSGRQIEAITALENLIAEYKSDSISLIAASISTGLKEGRLLQSGISTSIWERRMDGSIVGERDSVPTFNNTRDAAYYFVLAFPGGSVDKKRLLFEMARYNFSRYMVRNFEMSFEELPEITLFEVKEFLNFDEAFLYRKRLYENAETATLLEGINAIIISKDNLDLLLKHYTFEEYRKFYEENFMGIPEVEIDGYTLDKPGHTDKKRKPENTDEEE